MVLPVPTTPGPLGMAVWHTTGFLLGWERHFALLRAAVKARRFFYYVVHPADLTCDEDFAGAGKMYLERAGGSREEKTRYLRESLAVIRDANREWVTMAQMADIARAEGRATAFKGMSAAAKDKGLGAIADVAMRRLFAPEFQRQNPDLIADRKARFLAVDVQTFHGACEALSTLDLRPSLAVVTVPVLVMVGEQDEATPPPMSRELAAGLPNAKFVELKGCAHVPQLQAPDVFMATIKDFIAEEKSV